MKKKKRKYKKKYLKKKGRKVFLKKSEKPKFQEKNPVSKVKVCIGFLGLIMEGMLLWNTILIRVIS